MIDILNSVVCDRHSVVSINKGFHYIAVLPCPLFHPSVSPSLQYLVFTCGLLMGALSNLGIRCQVTANITSMPACELRTKRDVGGGFFFPRWDRNQPLGRVERDQRLWRKTLPGKQLVGFEPQLQYLLRCV